MKRTRPRPNPTWSNTVLSVNWPALRQTIDPAWLPRVQGRGGKVVVTQEYGEGVYGVAMPTNSPGVTLKVTTDAAEAQAAAILMHLYGNEWPHGIARHYMVVATEQRSKRRPVFLIWRENVVNVDRKWVTGPEAWKATNYLSALKFAGTLLRKGTYHRSPEWIAGMFAKMAYRSDWAAELAAQHARMGGRDTGYWMTKWKGQERTILAREYYRAIASEMTGVMYLSEIGMVLLDLLQEGVILPDVHNGNVAQHADRDEFGRELTVFDVGQAIVFDPKLARIEPKKLKLKTLFD